MRGSPDFSTHSDRHRTTTSKHWNYCKLPFAHLLDPHIHCIAHLAMQDVLPGRWKVSMSGPGGKQCQFIRHLKRGFAVDSTWKQLPYWYSWGGKFFETKGGLWEKQGQISKRSNPLGHNDLYRIVKKYIYCICLYNLQNFPYVTMLHSDHLGRLPTKTTVQTPTEHQQRGWL